MSLPIDRIQQLLTHIKQNPNLLEYEQVELPFQLLQATLKLWESLYTPSSLGRLAREEEETLDAWAIALSQTLLQQITLLENWLPLLSTLPIPPKLTAKIQQSYQSLGEVQQQKSQLLANTTTLFIQEQTLQKEYTELANLKHRQQELSTLQTELATTDLPQLEAEINTLAISLEPQRQQLLRLKSDKAQLQAEYDKLQQEKQGIEAEVRKLRSQQQQQQQQTTVQAIELTHLTQGKNQNLTPTLTTVLADLQEQQQEYQKVRQQLDKGIQDFNQYQQQTEELREHLKNHYQADEKLAQLLPCDRQKINTLLQSLQQQLTELDQELMKAQQIHAQSQRKQEYNFAS